MYFDQPLGAAWLCISTSPVSLFERNLVFFKIGATGSQDGDPDFFVVVNPDGSMLIKCTHQIGGTKKVLSHRVDILHPETPKRK